MAKDITSTRGTLDFLMEQDEVLVIKSEVDPIYEVSGITKACDGGPVLLFEKIKGYPGHRILSNIFSTRERVAKIFDVSDHKRTKFRALEALRKPIPAKVVKDAACQENIITNHINAPDTLPFIKHTETDAGRILGGGNTLVVRPDLTHVSFNRMHFRGPDWATISLPFGTHLHHLLMETRAKKGRLPLTINIGTPPAVLTAAGGGLIPMAMPFGSDELGIAGGLQGCPIETCQAKTIDAYAIASAEWVIEGYIDTGEYVWESDEAERLDKAGQGGTAPFFPEFTGYIGRAAKTFKFQVTAITHRDTPIFYAPLAHSIEGQILMMPIREAGFYDMADKLFPGFVVDCNILEATRGWEGVIFQVRKQKIRDEGLQRNLITATLGGTPMLRLVVVVDEDVNIYSADDVLWAISHRVDPATDIIFTADFRGAVARMGRGTAMERVHPGAAAQSGGVGFDATVPLPDKVWHEKGKYPKVDLAKWLSPQEIDTVRAKQSEYARYLAETCW